jgi:enterochelin esterase-like enzyme
VKGSLELVDVDSKALRGNPLGDPSLRRMPVYLPPGYAQSQARFPTLYFLHGFTGSGLQWINVSGFSRSTPQRLDDLIAEGKIPPFIGVFVDGWSALGGSQWENSEALGRYRDYLVEDVVSHLDAHFRTVPDRLKRAVLGKSSGGYGSLIIGREHPDVFAHLACHSGDAAFEYCYLPQFPRVAGALLEAGGVGPWFEGFRKRAFETKARGADHDVLNIVAMAAAYSPRKGAPLNLELPFDLETARLKPDVWGRWLEQDPVRFAQKALPAWKQLRSVFVECGTHDEFSLQWGARMLVETMKAGGLDVLHEEFEGGHMGTSYRYDRSVAWILSRMQ